MASRWDRLKSWMGSKPTSEELEQARTPTYAEANRLDPMSLEKSNAALREGAALGFKYSVPGLAYNFLTEDPEAEAELARVAANPIAGPASPTMDQSALLAAQRRLATNPIEGPERRQDALVSRPTRNGKSAAVGTGGSGTAPIRPEVAAYLEKKAAERGAPADDRDLDLEAAQNEAASRRAVTSAGRAGATLAAAFADQAPGTYQGFWDDKAKSDEQSVADLQARRVATRGKKADRQSDEDRARTLALDDPQSDQSRLARELFATKNPAQAKRFGDRLALFSANALAKLEPSIEKELDRAHQLRIRREDNAADIKRSQLAASAKSDGKGDQLYVPGFSRDNAKGSIKVEEAGKFRMAAAANAALQGKLAKLRALRAEHGQEVLPTGARAEMEALAQGVMLDIKDMEEMGALDAGTQAVAKTMIPQPGDFWNSQALAKLDTMASNANSKLEAKASALGYERAGGAKPSAPSTADNEALDWARRNPSDPRAARILQLNGA